MDVIPAYSHTLSPALVEIANIYANKTQWPHAGVHISTGHTTGVHNKPYHILAKSFTRQIIGLRKNRTHHRPLGPWIAAPRGTRPRLLTHEGSDTCSSSTSWHTSTLSPKLENKPARPISHH